MSVSERNDPFRNFRFLLEFPETSTIPAGFSECTLPEASNEPIEYREGTDKPTVRKLWNLKTYGDLTLNRGVTDTLDLYDWWKLVDDGQIDAARQPVAVIVQDEQGLPGARWEFEEAWPRQYDAPDLNATANEVAVESLQIAHEGMTRKEP